ncbi:MAG TPA: PfkB family carbohydrate kinase [Gaiellaceae bacterium]|nr:PfkB family carbohydrate kinase [Gaiellaceae bacterium]
MNVAVIGHVEWIEFVRVEHVPAQGEIVHAIETWAEAAGGGAVAAVQLARLAGASTLFTAVGDDELGKRVEPALAEYGVRVHAAVRPESQRRGFTFVDASGERTITVIGERLGPRRSDDLPWDALVSMDAVYFVSGDPAAVRAARKAKVLVATARSLAALQEARVELDALVRSRNDVGETYKPGDLDPPPRIDVATVGQLGGRFTVEGGPSHYQAAAVPGPLQDTYGAGDSFAAGLTYGLGEGLAVDEAIRLAARTGAAALARRGAHGV